MKALAILNAEPGKGFANIIRELKEKKSLNDRLHYLEDLVSSIKESIEKGSMDKTAIISYMRHFPKRGVEEGWPEEVYAISDECVKLLLDYSKQYSFFAKDVSYGMFIKEYRALLAD